MNTNLKRLLSLVLVFSMLLGMMPLGAMQAFAESVEESVENATASAKIGDTEYATLQAAIDAAKDGDVITLTENVTGDVTITQKADVDVVIDGKGKTFTGVMTVFGNGRQSGAETLTIKNVVFQATAGATSCIVSPDRTVNNLYSYSHNVTIDNCEFKGNLSTPLTAAAIRQEDGGDKNWTITNCKVDANMHSMLQVNNVEGKLTVGNCEVYSKNGLNLNSCTNVEITNSTIDVKGYAVRSGVKTGGNLGTEKNFVLTNNVLESAGDDGDAVIMFRASAVDAKLDMTKNVVSGTTHISGHTEKTSISANNNYWDGKSAPVVPEGSVAVSVDSYYTDTGLTELITPAKGTITYGYVATGKIWGECTSNATESVVIKIYSGDTYMGYASLNNIDNIIDGDVYVTWNMPLDLASDSDSYWEREWVVAPSLSTIPTKVVLYVDGVEIDENDVKFSGADDVDKVPAAIVDENGKILSFASLQDAINQVADGGTVALVTDVEQQYGVVITDRKLTIDLNGKTFTVTKGDDSTVYRNLLINGVSEVTIKNGTVVSKGTTTGTTSSGVWGSVRTEGTAKVTMTGLKLYNYRGNGLNVKALTGTTVTISDTEIYSQYGGGVEAAGGTIELNNVKVEQTGLWTAPYNSMAISVNGGGKITVNSGTYTTEPLAATDAYNQGTSHGSWVAGVLNSGGKLVINGGTFSNGNYGDDALATVARGLLLADTGAVIEVNGGNFNALKDIIDYQNNLGDASKNPTVEIYSGFFSAPIPAEYCGDGYVPVQLANGKYGVKAQHEAKIGNKNYATLKEAIEAAEPNDRIIIQANISVEEEILVSKSITIADYGTFSIFLHGAGGFRLTNGATVAFENLDIEISNAVAGDDAIIEVTGGATLKFTSVDVTGNGYSSAYGIIYLYETGNFNMEGGSIVVSNDNSSSGGIIKANGTAVPVINISNVTITADNVSRGFIDGTVNLDNVNFTFTNGDNAINQSALTVKNSTLTVKDCVGRALTLSQGNVSIINSALNFSNCSEGEIRFKQGLTLNVDAASTIAECDIYADSVAVGGAKVNDKFVTGSETNPSTIVNATVTNPAFAQVNGTGYDSLQEAINNANGATITLTGSNPVAEPVSIPAGATVVIDLGGKTFTGYFAPFGGNLTVKNGSIVNTNASYSAIEINAGNLVLENVNIASARHAVRIDGAVTATIKSGTYKVDPVAKGTYHAVNISGAATLTIEDGTFVGPKGTTADSGAALNIKAGVKVTIENGNFSGGKNNTISSAGELTISGGSFDQKPADAWLAEGYTTVLSNGTYYVVKNVVKTTIYVNSAWADKSFGAEVETGKVIGVNAFVTFEDALNAVTDGAVIVLADGMTGDESKTEIDFTEAISFTITGKAPNYALPIVTFQNATVTIKDAEILIPELDARQNATINVVNSTVYGAGGDSIAKSYYNGAINISGNSVVHMMQVTTMGYITISGGAKLTATWQTNVYGNGMIVVKKGATFNTAALHLTGQDYSSRDNTDAGRVGKPATIVVDGANLIVGKAYSSSGADYSYNSSHGINVGTVDGKNAVLDIKNGATVSIYMANGETANIGAGGTVNVDASTLTVECRAENGKVTFANNGKIYVTGKSAIAGNFTGDGWVYMNDVTLDADTKLHGAKVGFINGTNTIVGSTIDGGFFSVGIGQNAEAAKAVAFAEANGITLGDVTVNVSGGAVIGGNGATYSGWVGSAYSADKTQHKYVLNIENSLATFGYMHVSKDGELSVKGHSTNKYTYDNANVDFYAGDLIVNGVVTLDGTDAWVKYTKMSVDAADGVLNIVNGTNFEASIHNGSTTSTSLKFWKAGEFNVDATSTVEIDNGTTLVDGAKLNIAGDVTAKGAVTGNGTITLTAVGATLTAPAGLTVLTTVENQIVVYNNGVYSLNLGAAKIGNTVYATLAEAFAAAQEGDTITLLADATPALTSQKAITKASVINLNGKVLTLKEDDLYFGTTKFVNGTIVVDPSVNASTAVFWMFAGQTLTFDAVEIVATGVTGTYLIGINGGSGSAVNLLNGSKITIDNTTKAGLSAVICDNGTGNSVVIDNSEVYVANIDGRFYLGGTEGSINVNDSKITLNGVKEGFYLRARQTLDITGNSVVNIALNDTNGRYGINVTDATAIYTKADTATVNSTLYIAPFKVSNKAELNAALNAAKDGNTILLIADIDYGTDQLKIEKAITLDLGGKTLTTRNAYGGMALKNNCSVVNGTIVHASNTAAIKAWNVAKLENLTIDVQGKGDANKTIGGIVIQSGTAVCVGSIKDVTIKGAALTNGIETYNCGDAVAPVIGAMENVNIDATGTGMLISALCGTATNCTIKGGVNAIELWIKGTYSASLNLVDSKVEGGVFAHDEFNSDPSIVNSGELSLTIDEKTTGVDLDDITLTLARAEEVAGVLEKFLDQAQAKVNNTYYLTLAEAFAAAKAGDTVTIFAGNYTTNISVNKAITVIGETDADGKNLVMINGGISITADGATVKNLTASNPATTGYDCTLTINAKDVLIEGCVITDNNAMRYSYTSGKVTFKDCTLTATGTWVIHFDGRAGGDVTVDNCEVNGWIGIGGGIKVTLKDSKFNNGNWAGGNLYGDDITIKGCNFNNGFKFGIISDDATVNVIDSTMTDGNIEDLFKGEDIVTSNIIVDGKKLVRVARIGSAYYETLQDAIDAIPEGSGTYYVYLTGSYTGAGVVIDKNVVINFNNYTYTFNKGVGSTGTTSNGFQILKGSNVTLKNGTLKVADEAAAEFYILIQNYADTLTVENMVLDGTNLDKWSKTDGDSYVLSNNNGTTTIKNTEIIANNDGDKAFAFDSCDSASYAGAPTVNVVSGEFTGKIEVTGNATLAISGGTFTVPVAEAWCAKDYIPVDNGDGTYGVKFGKYVARVNGVGYETLAEALEAAKAEKNIVIDLVADATLDITAWDALAIGGDSTETITINGNGHTLTFNKLNSDWNHIVTNNDAKLILNNMTITDSGKNNGPWNRYDLNFGCDVELNGVTATKAVAFKADAKLNNVTINETNDAYAIWVQANGQTIEIDGLTVTSAGRGIKIDEQYVDNAAKVELSIQNATFTTAKKAAIMIKSVAGAEITASNVNISGVAADQTNLVWVDEDAALYFGEVTVTGGTTAQENVESFEAAIVRNNAVISYYKTLTDAFTAAQNGDEVVILKAGTYALTGISGKNITVTGDVNGVVFDNIGAKNMGGANVTFNKVTFDYYPNVNYTGLQHSGNLVYNNCTINGQVFLYGTSETFNNCTFNQNSADAYNVWTYGAKEVAFNECTFNSVGKSVLIYSEQSNLFNDVTVTDCDFIASAPVDGKAAIEMNSEFTEGINLTIDAATTATGFANGNVSGNSLWNNKMGNNTDANNDITVVVNGETVLAPVTFVAYIGNIGYTSIADAIKAAQVGDTVTIMAGNYTTDISVNKAITVVGETDANGNNLVNITGRVSASTGATVKNLNVHNDKTGDYDCALNVSGSNIVIDGVKLTGYNGMRYCYAKGDITIKNSTINGSNFAVHFDGSNGGNLMIDNCDITGWVSYGGGIDNVTLKDSTFKKGPYAGQRSYAENLVIEGSTFEAGYTLDIGVTGSTVTVTDSKMSDDSAILELFKKDDLCGQNTVTIDGKEIAYVAKIGNDYYESLAEALANVADWTTIKLVANATLDYNARDVFGRDTTTDIIIDGQGYTLTLNQKNSDWSSIGMKNSAGKLTLKNMTIEKTGYGDTSGAWNTHAIIFSCNVEMNNVTVNNSMAVQNGATLNNVTINEANGYYGLWINGNGQTVTINGGAINATNGGRGIKIADQYIDAPASVTLTVDGTKFSTAKKAAVLVSSKAGADITASNVDITNVAEDTVNFVWVDEDWAAYYGEVTVTGGTKAQENVDAFVVAIMLDNGVASYYKTLAAAVAGAKVGDVIVLLADTDAKETAIATTNITIDLNGKTLKGEVNGPVIRVQNGAAVIVKNGTITNDHYIFILGASDGTSEGNLTIESGKFHGETTVASVTKGTLTINGGEFRVDAYEDGQNFNFMLNCIDANFRNGTAKIVVTGGTFYNFNPADNAAEGAHTSFVDTTVYHAKSNGNGSFTVAKHTVAALGTNIDATCTTKGLKAGTYCTDCMAILTMPETVDELGHAWVDATVDAPKTCSRCGATEGEAIKVVAEVNGVKYETLQEAIDAAKAGDTITLIGNVTENVTINKNLVLDGDEFNYTGTMTVNTSLTVTIQNVNFVKGCVTEGKGTSGTLTIKNCDFDGVDNSIAYAVTMRGGNAITLEGCTSKNYDYGMLYIPSPVTNVTVKDTEVSGVSYGVHVAYGTNVTLDNVKMDNVAYGIMTQNYGAKTITIRNCNINATNAIYVWERNTTVVDTFKFEGANTLSNLSTSAQAKLVLANVNATLTAPEGANVTTTLENHKVVYENGVYMVVAMVYVAELNGVKYETLQEAINAATAGDTIVLIGNVIENVTVSETITIDGANFKYTGSIAVSGSTTELTVKNVNFVDYTDDYAITTNTIKSITVENCTLNGYDGFLYANQSTPTVVVKNVTMNGGIYGIHWVYGTTATLENVTMTNVVDGLLIQNYAGKTITLKNCDISSINVWEKASGVQTFVFEGENTVDSFGYVVAKTKYNGQSQYAKYVLAAADATLAAPEGANVTTNVDGHKVDYKNGVYTVVECDYVVSINGKNYESLQEAINAAQDGAENKIVLLKDIVLDGSTTVTEGKYGYDTLLLVKGKQITIDFNGYTVKVTPNAPEASGGIAGLLEAIIFIDEDASLTLKDSVGNGGFKVYEGTDLYSLFYNSGSTLAIEGGNYFVERTITNGSIIYADSDHATTISGGNFTLLNAGEASNTKPWVTNVEGKNSGIFVVITGGTFNQDPYINKDREDGNNYDCEVTIPDEYHIHFVNNRYVVEEPVEVIDPAVGATCTTTGLTEGSHCKVCGKTIVEQTIVDKTSHTEVVDAAVDATCSSTGLTAGSHCSVCGEILVKQDVVPMTEHRISYASVNGVTCTTDGYITIHCGDCGVTFDSRVNQEALDYLAQHPWYKLTAQGHKEVVDAAVGATCTTTGLTEGKHCSVCGEILVKQDVVPMIPHTEGAIVVENNVAPDCKNTGSYDNVVYCTVCGVELSRVTITVDKLPHTEGTLAAVAPTCTTTGLTEGKYCEVCGEVLVAQNEIAMIDHVNKTTTTVDATCESVGYTTVTCDDCGKLISITQIAAKGHNYVDGVCTVCMEVGEAVATIDGVKYATLEKAIEAAKNGDVIELLANIKLDDRITIDKTITIDLNGKKISASSTVFTVAAQGVLTLTNGTIDGFNQSNGTILNAGGTLILNDGMAVNMQLNIRNISILHRAGTLVVNGGTYLNKVTIGDTATIYDGTFISEITVSDSDDLTIYGGTFAQDVTVWCADGYHSVDPDGDGMYVVDKHNYVFDKHVDPTCTEAGYTTYKCVCGLVEQKDHVAATGHTNVVVVDGKAPTCTEPGLTAGLKCNDCEKMLQAQVEIPMLEAVVQLEVYDANTGITTITKYATIAEAIVAGKKGDTIKLLKNYDAENQIMITRDVTFDLNGYTLKATYFAAFFDSDVVDNGVTLLLDGNGNPVLDDQGNKVYVKSKSGLLVVPQTGIELPHDNAQMPVYDAAAGGYRLFDVSMQSQYTKTKTGFEILYRPSIGKAFNASYFGSNVAATQLTFEVRFTWTDKYGNTDVQYVIINREQIERCYTNSTPIKVSLSDIQDFEEIKIDVVLESEVGVTMTKYVDTFYGTNSSAGNAGTNQ